MNVTLYPKETVESDFLPNSAASGTQPAHTGVADVTDVLASLASAVRLTPKTSRLTPKTSRLTPKTSRPRLEIRSYMRCDT